MKETGQQLEIGSTVKMDYKTGVYVGELIEVNAPRGVVKVLAVLKHPDQGDLHNPYDPDVPMFHERRALSYTEKALTLLRDIKPYAGKVPEYKASLAQALQAEIDMLDKLKRWAERGLEQLEGLGREYK